jgi:tRNA A-37 threonylcarbamoyl transferase component Bud32
MPAMPSRFRFASSGATTGGAADIAAHLRPRLRFIVRCFGLLYIFIAVTVLLRVATVPSMAGGAQTRSLMFTLLALTPLFVWTDWRLRPNAALSLEVLRRFELGVFALLAALGAAAMYVDFLTYASVMPSLPVDFGLTGAGLAAPSIVAYGVLIPNTWRRCASVVAGLSVIAFVPDVFSVLQHEIPTGAWVTFFSVKLAFIGIAAALAIFGAYRIEVADSAARAARQLGQYLLLEQIGAGGMGEVHRAEHRFLRRPCAVKLIRAEQADDPEVLRRFEREVQATAALTHPNTVQIYDYGIGDDGTFFYVMEYLPGMSLHQEVERGGPMPPARAVHILHQVAGALVEAHAAGLTHRDIKPGNVMLCERGGIADVAKLLDFGLVVSRLDGVNDSRITQAGMILGTPAYMSPEQCAGEEQPGEASDIYSLGAVAYFLLTGQAPFEGRGPMQIIAAHLREVPRAPRELQPAITVELDALVMRCLAKSPSERVASAREFEQALTVLRAGMKWTDREARDARIQKRVS